MTIRQVTQNKKQYLDLLLLADEQEDMIDRYLERGTMYVMEDGEKNAIAECVVTDEGEGTLEIKSIAVQPDCAKMDYGRKMIQYIEKTYAGRYHTLIVGTGDSPSTVPFYEKCGFVRSHVVKDFFTDNYREPIIDGGVILRDMVYFKRRFDRKKTKRDDCCAQDAHMVS